MQRNSSKLLIQEDPLILLPSLAVLIGDREAIALQQVQYWLTRPPNDTGSNVHIINDRRWVYNSVRKWRRLNFPFWSEKTIQRIFERLENFKLRGQVYHLLLSMQPGKSEGDMEKWYTINYDELNRLEESGESRQSARSARAKAAFTKRTICPSASGQNDQMGQDRLSKRARTECPNLTENTSSENTTENTYPADASGAAAGETAQVTLTEQPQPPGAIIPDREEQVGALVDEVMSRVEHRVVVAARRVAAEEGVRTREYVDRNLPKAARVATAETIETLRRNGVDIAPKRRRRVDVGRGGGDAPPPPNLFPTDNKEFAEICVTMLLTQGQSFDATIEQLMTPGGGGLTPDEAPEVRQLAEAMYREQQTTEVPSVRVITQ